MDKRSREGTITPSGLGSTSLSLEKLWPRRVRDKRQRSMIVREVKTYSSCRMSTDDQSESATVREIGVVTSIRMVFPI